MKKLVVFLFITACFAASIAAQATSRTTVSGSVKDQAGALVAGARVILLNTQTRMGRTTVSSASGAFTFDKVAAGEYEVRIVANGFARQTQTLQVTSAGVNDLEIALAIGESRVTVTAEVGQTERTENVPRRLGGLARAAGGPVGIRPGAPSRFASNGLAAPGAPGRSVVDGPPGAGDCAMAGATAAMLSAPATARPPRARCGSTPISLVLTNTGSSGAIPRMAMSAASSNCLRNCRSQR